MQGLVPGDGPSDRASGFGFLTHAPDTEDWWSDHLNAQQPNKNLSFHEAPEKAGGEGWLHSEQQQKLCRFKPDMPTVHAQWVAIRTYSYVPLRPRRFPLHAEKSTRSLSDEQMGLLIATIARAAHLDCNAVRDYALDRGSCLLGCRVSEIVVIRWKDIEVLSDGGQIHLFGKGSKARTVRVSSDTLELFQSLGRGEADGYVFPRLRVERHLTRQAIGDVCRKWGRAAGFHVHPRQLRHSHATHAMQRGVDVFTLQATLGYSSSATTGHYVVANPRDSRSLRLG